LTKSDQLTFRGYTLIFQSYHSIARQLCIRSNRSTIKSCNFSSKSYHPNARSYLPGRSYLILIDRCCHRNARSYCRITKQIPLVIQQNLAAQFQIDCFTGVGKQSNNLRGRSCIWRRATSSAIFIQNLTLCKLQQLTEKKIYHCDCTYLCYMRKHYPIDNHPRFCSISLWLVFVGLPNCTLGYKSLLHCRSLLPW